jgi:hypothetical protein
MLRETQVRWRGGGGDGGVGAAARCVRVRVTLLLLLLQLLSVMLSMPLLLCRACCRGGRTSRISSPSTLRQEAWRMIRVSAALSSASAARRPCSLSQTQVCRRRSITVIQFQYHNTGLPPSFVSVQHAQQVQLTTRPSSLCHCPLLILSADPSHHVSCAERRCRLPHLRPPHHARALPAAACATRILAVTARA